jgi:hypothetical protein
MLQQSRRNENKCVTPSNFSARPTAPDVLIHMHIPKTGGTSLNSLVQHGFRNDEVFDATVVEADIRNGLGLATFESCQQLLAAYAPGDVRSIRYVSGHLPMGLHRMFDRSSKYFTVIRDPINRAISSFFFLIQQNKPYLKDGRLLTLEEYAAARCDVRLCNYQVRVVSGCSELVGERLGQGMQTPGTPVERCHLEEAKRNIEEHFLAAAPLENITELALLLRRVYGWPMRRLLTEYKNRTTRRPRMHDISPQVIKIIEECNFYDLELYEWVRKRFTAQLQQFEPELSKDRRAFETISRALNVAGKVLPWSARKRLAQALFYA